jgi:hypothetical protein
MLRIPHFSFCGMTLQDFILAVLSAGVLRDPELGGVQQTILMQMLRI